MIVSAMTRETAALKQAQYRQAWGKGATTLEEYDYYARARQHSRSMTIIFVGTTSRKVEAMATQIRGPLPIKVDATSNGEFRPVPLTEPVARANRKAEFRIKDNAERVGIGRRTFLQSLCGAATTLLTLNEGDRGGRRRARRRGVHLRRADPYGRPSWRLAQLRWQILGANPREIPTGLLWRRRPGRLLFRREVHQARVHGQRH